MEVIGPDKCVAPLRGSAVTIGAYDGLHIGHRRLLAQLTSLAGERELTSVVVTFDRHPASVVRPGTAPLLLTSLEQKIQLIAECGIDRTLVIPFDHKRAEESAEEFVEEVLVAKLGTRLVVVGEDFHFGHSRRGNVKMLADKGSEFGFEVVGVALSKTSGEPVSSTRIRRLLANGDVEEASTLLGRDYEVSGEVVHGDGRGASLVGFPTANLAIPTGFVVPGEGIYACRYRRPDGTLYSAAVSVGRRPTFYGEDDEVLDPVVEAYIMDFDGDLYGEVGTVSFVARLRAERKFDSIEELAAQMSEDVEQAESVLAGRGERDLLS